MSGHTNFAEKSVAFTALYCMERFLPADTSFTKWPRAYFVTFCCYGKHLPGQLGAIDRKRHLCGGPTMPESVALEYHIRSNMTGRTAHLHRGQRPTVLHAMVEVCSHQGWNPIAIHVRSDHVHAVIQAETDPETVMVVFKRYASCALNKTSETRRWWARHGSTRYLWTSTDVSAAVKYVVEEQGEPMALWARE